MCKKEESFEEGSAESTHMLHKEDGLKQAVGLFDGSMLIIGCIIGAGIFFTPRGVYEHVGSIGLALTVWIISGAFTAIGAYCYAELGTFIKSSGGDYAYVLKAFGPFMGYLRMWIECIIMRPCIITIVSMAFSSYILQPFFPQCEAPRSASILFSLICISTLAFINAYSVKLATLLQNVLTVVKLISIAIFILTGLLALFIEGSYSKLIENLWANSNFNPGSLALAFYSALWAYNGWNYLNYVTEEIINPKRTLPRAIGISCIACILIYTLINIAFCAAVFGYLFKAGLIAGINAINERFYMISISREEFLESNAVATLFAEKYYGGFAWVVPILVATFCIGTVNGMLLSSSRLFYVAGRNGHLPTILGYINPYRKTPVPAVLVTATISSLYLFSSNNIYKLINHAQITNWLAILVVTLGLFYLRIKLPTDKYPRPIKVNLIWPSIFLIGCIFLVVFPLYEDPYGTAFGLVLTLTGLPLYVIFVRYRDKSRWMDKFVNSFNVTMQKILLVVPSKNAD